MGQWLILKIYGYLGIGPLISISWGNRVLYILKTQILEIVLDPFFERVSVLLPQGL